MFNSSKLAAIELNALYQTYNFIHKMFNSCQSSVAFQTNMQLSSHKRTKFIPNANFMLNSLTKKTSAVQMPEE